jgi:NADPH:quinone reductase-like Zn-dependent oxidoreductase
MNDFLNKHEIHPVIDKVYAFEQAREAYKHLGRGAFGKIVIKVGA